MYPTFFRLKTHFSTIFKRNISALHIRGDKANDTFVVVSPYLDFDERIKNRSDFEKNLELRGLDVNLNEIIRLWNFYKHVELKKINLEESQISISQTIKNLSRKGGKFDEKINTLKAHGKMVKEDMKVLKESLWPLEEKAAIAVLSLPNILHEKTPESDSIVYTFLEKSNIQSKSHIEIGENLNLLEYNNPYNYFLKNDSALFEYCTTLFLSEKLSEKQFIQFSNSDFTRSVVVEGCGLNFTDPTKVLTIKEDGNEYSRLHLTGSASLPSFMAYYCKHAVFPTHFPLKHFCIGKKYQPPINQTNSLLNVAQETSANIFIATKTDEEMNIEFEKILQDSIDIYKTIGIHFRVCHLSAKQLNHWESLRASIQLFSPYLNQYVEVGNISLCGDFVSKRLLFNCGKGFNITYPFVITGTLLSVPKLLACVLENDFCKNNQLLSDVLKKYL